MSRYFLILTVIVFITFANALNNTFVSDDIAEIAKNPNISNFSYIFSHPFGFIRLILNWIVYEFAGLTPIGFRLINIFFHIGSVFLIYILLSLLLKSKKLAFFISAIFAVHPGASEAVVWISGGTYPQYTFFFFLSFIFYILSPTKKFFYLLSCIFYLLSFMSHPVMPLPLFLIFPLYEFSFGNLKKNWFKTLPFLGISIAYVLINFSVLPERETTLHAVHYQERGVDNIFILIPIAISSYFELIFWPKILTLYHSELAFNSIQFIIKVVVTLFYFGALIFTFLKNKKIFFFLSFFIIALSPTLTPFRFNWIVAERYLYLPILGIITVVVILFDKLFQKIKIKYLELGILVVIILLLMARTIVRNIDWKNEDNLWIATGKTSPSSPNNHNNLGDVYGRWGDKQKAIQEFQTAIALKPNYADAFHNLANTYLEVGDRQKALENYQKAIDFNPNLWQSYQNIAAIYFQDKKYDKALDYMQKAIQINHKNINLYNNLGIVYLSLGDKEKAKQIFTQVLSQDPQNQFAKQGLFETSK